MRKKRFLIALLVILASFLGSKLVLDKLYASSQHYNYGDDKTYTDNSLKKEDGQYLILVVGVDKNAETESTDFTRTDTIMLISADTKTGKMDLLSIPRDSRIKIRDKFDKVNHAHAFGGIELTMQTLRQFLGLDIDYYVQVNYQALINIVDALGGVDYDVPEGIKVDRGYIQIEPGPNHLDGQGVMWLLRTRDIYNNGDIGRVNTQQQFVKAMVDEMVKKSKNMNIMTFVTNYIRYVKTNLPMNAIMDLAGNINSFSSEKMDTHTVPGMEQTINGTSYWIPDYEKTWKIVDDVFENFKLEKWSKEDSGYREYQTYEKIEDQSKDPGIEVEEKTSQPQIQIPQTQSLPMQNQPVEVEEEEYYEETYEEETYETEPATENSGEDLIEESMEIIDGGE